MSDKTQLEQIEEILGDYAYAEVALVTGHDPRKDWVTRKAGAQQILDICQPQWIDMESAPKDGTEIILKVNMRAGIQNSHLVGHYMRGGHCIEDHPPISAGWYFWNGCMFDKAAEPVSWMPLPEDTA